MKKYFLRAIIISSIALVFFAIDAYTKSLVLEFFTTEKEESIKIFSILNIAYVKNYGISFGSFNSESMNQLYLIGLTSLITLVLFVWGIRTKNSKLSVPIAMIIGGAIGNIFDRIQYGAVIDFLDFHYGAMHYPAFNVADSLIFLGVVAIIFTPEHKEG